MALIKKTYNNNKMGGSCLSNSKPTSVGFRDGVNFVNHNGTIYHCREYKGDEMTWVDKLVNELPLEVTYTCELWKGPKIETVLAVPSNTNKELQKVSVTYSDCDDYSLKIRKKKKKKRQLKKEKKERLVKKKRKNKMRDKEMIKARKKKNEPQYNNHHEHEHDPNVEEHHDYGYGEEDIILYDDDYPDHYYTDSDSDTEYYYDWRYDEYIRRRDIHDDIEYCARKCLGLMMDKNLYSSDSDSDSDSD